jgi:hypothetical protein
MKRGSMRTRRLRRAVVFAAVVLTTGITPAAAWAAEPATGSIAGVLTHEGDALVTVNLFTTGGMAAGQTTSDSAGRFSFPAVAPGGYKVQFGLPSRYDQQIQWASQQTGFTKATVFAVTSGQTTEVDDTMLDPGVVEIVATDADTGSPVDDICASQYENFETDCGGDDGVLRLTDLDDGKYRLYISSPSGLHARTVVDDVTVKFGTVTRVPVRLKPTTAIRTTVLDKATGAPVPGVCVAALTLTSGGVDSSTCDQSQNVTDENGEIQLGELDAGEYTLLAIPEWLPYGIQWVGPSGGVGSQYKALRVVANVGAASTVAPIRLDPPASISGTITDAATGEPSLYACAAVMPSANIQDPPFGASCTQWDGGGHYSIDTLGPYKWPVQFTPYQDDKAAVWSGGAVDRKAATLVQAGGSTELNAQLPSAGEGMRLKVLDPDGMPYQGWLNATAYNARTGDFVDEFDYSYRSLSQVLAQPVKIRFSVDGYKSGWYGGSNFATAKSARVDPDNPTTVTIRLQPED